MCNTLILTLSIQEPVDSFPPGYSAFLWVLADLHPRPPPHLHQLTTVRHTDVNRKEELSLARSETFPDTVSAVLRFSYDLIDTTQRGLFRARHQMCSDTNHVDLILLKQSYTEHQAQTGETIRNSFYTITLFTFLLSSIMLCSDMLLVPTMISELKAGTEKLQTRSKMNNKKKGNNGNCVTYYRRSSLRVGFRDILMNMCSMVPHSLLTAESEDTTDIERLPAQVPAVQTNPHRPVAQFTQRQGHGTEIQEAATEITYTQFILHIFTLSN